MDDKVFDLVTKMYGELTEFRKETNKRLDNLENGQKKMEMKIEHNIETKIQALYEDREVVHEKLDEINSKVENLSSKIEMQELEIRVIKGGGDDGNSPKGKKKKAQ